ncbi:hypothetical protein WN51_04701 [Melipona quadrifasciata]|uniref:Uncharacterized protein n=1 Tax=Melipona quadrifasciata TaxID=166423 RepID=A0A0M9AC62_9HYME|nr:hypothetical protein WN51_04701 [Melipona quadrifasciata]
MFACRACFPLERPAALPSRVRYSAVHRGSPVNEYLILFESSGTEPSDTANIVGKTAG